MKQRHSSRKLPPATFRPRLEALENRWCLSCTVTHDGDTLFIAGDRTDDRLEIVDRGGRGLQVICDGDSQTFSGITRVVGDLGGGNNNLTVDLDAQSNVESLSFKFGSGDDLVMADFGAINGILIDFNLGAGDDTFTANFFPTESIAPAPSDLPPGPCKLDVFGEQGNDRLSLFIGDPNIAPQPNLDCALAVNFEGGGGDDTALIDITNVVVNAPMSLSMNLGGGDDIAALNAYNVALNADAVTNVIGGGGGDTVGIVIVGGNVATGASLAVNAIGGDGGDTVGIVIVGGNVATGASLMVDVDGGGGGDTVDFITFGGTVARDARFDIEVHGGDGADVLRGSTVGLLVDGAIIWCFEGNAGNDVIDARLDFDPNSHGMIDVEVMGSAGDDDLTLGISGIGDPGILIALVDGGDGFDVAHVTRNVLVRDCEEVSFIE